MRLRSAPRGVAAVALVVVLGCVLATACVPPPSGHRVPPEAGPQPVPLLPPAPPSEQLLAAHAELLRLEDRREYDAQALERLASDSAGPVRARTALALARLRRPASGELMLGLLADPDTAVAATAAFALGQLGDSAYAAPLAARLAGADGSAPTVAAEVAYALGEVGGAAARASLERLLASGSVADTAPPGVAAALLAVWKLPRLQDVEAITRWLDSPDPELRWRAAYALTRRPEPRALPLLRRALGDADERVRAQAVRGLTAASADSAGVPGEALVREVAPLLDDVSYEVAINAARVLGSHPLASAAAALAPAASSPRRHLAIAATEALGRIGEVARAAAPQLAAVAGADSLPVALRAAAIEALAQVDPAAAVAVAERFAALPAWRLRAAAARAFAIIDLTDARLRDGLADDDPRVANAALQAAIDEADDDLLPIRPLLVEQLGAADPIVRATALSALTRIPDPSLLPALLDAFARAERDTVNDASLAALDALGALAEHGVAPSRAFLTRFARPDDALIRRRAVERLDSAAVEAAWGPALPVETGRPPAEYRALVDRFVAPALAGTPSPLARLITDGDTIVLRLLSADAPLTVESFLRLADAGFFDGQEWPRVVPNFVVQGGDPRGDTSGGPGYTIRDEISRNRYGSGALGMALAGPDTGGSQFFITHSAQPHLDGTYAVFGQLVAGRAATERLLPGDTIDSIRSVR